MTLLYVDGFEQFGAPGGTADVNIASPGRYGVGATISRATGRFGTGTAAAGASGAEEIAVSVTGSALLTTGVAHRRSGTSRIAAFYTNGGSLDQLGVFNNGANGLELRRGNSASDTLLASSAPNVVPTSAWVYIEIKVSIADSGGTAVVRVNGVTVINFTGDTQRVAGNGLVDHMRLASTHTYDDWYILNSLGSAPYNDFLGDVRVDTLIPNGNGSNSGLLGSDGNSTDNYLLVDEAPPSATDYNGSATPGAKDTYAMSNLPATVTNVLAVQHSWYALKSDAGAASARSVVKSGATTATGSTVALPTSMAFQQDLRTVDPATSAAWTVAAVNAVETGMEVV